MFGGVLKFIVVLFLNIFCLCPVFFFYRGRLLKCAVKNIPIYREIACLYLMRAQSDV
jgi:hypothetical protein